MHIMFETQEDCDISSTFTLRPELLEKRLTELAKQGKNVKAFILLNPQNPLGEIYSESVVMDLLRICAK